MPINPIVIIAGAALLAGLIFLGVRSAQARAERERRRIGALEQWAAANGFFFNLRDPWNLDYRYNGVADIGKGHDRYAFETLTRESPVPAAIFQYHFKTWETRTVTRNGRSHTDRYEKTHWCRYLIVELGVVFPQLVLRTEGLFDRIAGLVGFDDIDFESEEFSKRYFCKGDDRQFAYAVIHPQMMEWLMIRRYERELKQGLLVMNVGGRPHAPEGCQEAWGNAAGFINRIPDFLWQDYARHAPIKLPDPVPYVPPAPAQPPLATAS